MSTPPKVDVWFPTYIDEFLMMMGSRLIERDAITGFLAMKAHYWRHGPFEDITENLAKISYLTRNRFEKNRAFFLNFFEISDGVWRCPLMDKEKEKAIANHNARSKGGHAKQAARMQKEAAQQAAQHAAEQAATIATATTTTTTTKVIKLNIDEEWIPSPASLKILEKDGISREFIDDAVPEFILYWQERGPSSGNWSSIFNAHIRRQWKKYVNTLEHEQDPLPISSEWQPDGDVFDILRLANIDIAYACELLPEFILFWRDAGTPYRSWNTKFLQHVKYQWATRHHMAAGNRPGSAIANGVATTLPNNAFDRLTDRSWAIGIVGAGVKS